MSWGMTMWRTVTAGDAGDHSPTGNEVISMLKTTSLVTAVPFTLDLFGITSREIAAREFAPVPLLMWRRSGTWWSPASDGRPVLPGAVLLTWRIAES